MDNFISFVLLSGGASTRMGSDKGLIHLNDKPLIQLVIESVENFLNVLNLKKKIPIKVSLHDYVQQEEYLDTVPSSFLKEDQIIVDENIWNKTFSDIPKPPQESILGIWSAMTELKNSSANIFFLPCDAPIVSEIFLSYIFDKFFKDLKKPETNNGYGLGFEEISLFKSINSKMISSEINNRETYNAKRKNNSQDLNNTQKNSTFNRKKYLSYVPVWENGKLESLFSIYHVKSLLPIIERNILMKNYSLQEIFSDILNTNDETKDDNPKYKIKLKTIPFEKEFAKEDLYLNNFLDINSIENLRQAEKIIQSMDK